MYGQLVAVEHGWPVQAIRPVIRLRRRCDASMVQRPALEATSRVLVGAVLGVAVGAATLHLALWTVIGAGLAVAVGRMRDRAL
jgi:hypothetical protein